MADKVLVGSLTQVGHSATVVLTGEYNFSLSGNFVGNVAIQRQFADDTTKWYELTKDKSLATSNYTGPVSVVLCEVEREVTYRVNCLSLTSGTVNFRISQ